MLKDVIFPRFGVPRYLMTDGGSHFIHGGFRKTLAKYDVNHGIALAYHPQTRGKWNFPIGKLNPSCRRLSIDLGKIGLKS